MLKSATLRGNRIIEASNIAKGFDDKLLFKDSSFYIKRGEKVAVFGENGCGKTTLLKILMGIEETDKGEIFLSSSAKLGYLSQDIAHLDLNKKVLDCFDIISREEKGKLQTLLFNMGLYENMLTHAIGTLSLGELTRLRVAELITNECDLLILEEPLNHLDIHSREKLEDVLKNYNGTIIMVSHDKYMIDRICNKLLVFECKNVKRLEIGLNESLETKPNPKKDNLKVIKEKKMLIENEASFVLGELCKLTRGTEEYIKMDLRFEELMNAKKEMEV
jgi:macrolide transport system ATP-binding/permease protein